MNIMLTFPRLPNLKTKLLSEMRSIRDNLQNLPKCFEENPQAELWSLCLMFTKAVNEYCEGNSDGAHKERICFLQQCDRHYLDFQADILRTRLKFRVSPGQHPDHDEHSQDTDGIITLCDLANVTEISLDEVRDLIKRLKKGELPGITPFRVHVHLIKRFVEDWEQLCLLAFRKVEILLDETVRDLCDSAFGRFRSSGLLSDVRS